MLANLPKEKVKSIFTPENIYELVIASNTPVFLINELITAKI